MSSSSAISARNLGKCYQIYSRPLDRLKQAFWCGRKRFHRDFWALKDISFYISKGETVGIIGSNGSGKSTLLQLLCGTLNPSEGEIEVNGRIAALLELGAGFNPDFTGRENVYISAAIMGLSRQEIDARFDQIVAFADIGPFIDQPVKIYSNGMYLRLAFATAVNVSPDILVVDEALAVGDIRFQQKCLAKMKEFCRTGTVIFVSHGMFAITELCSRVIWINSGHIEIDGAPQFVVDQYYKYMIGGENNLENVFFEVSEAWLDDYDISDFSSIGHEIRQSGNLRATIVAAGLFSQEGKGVVSAGRPCEIGIVLHAYDKIAKPVFAYSVKDRLDRVIFSDNTIMISNDIKALYPEKQYMVIFRINAWPNLAEDDYLLSLAVADGTMDEDGQCHSLYDTLVIRNIRNKPASGFFSVIDTDVFFEEFRG